MKKKLIPVFAITVLLLSQAIVASYGKENEHKNANANSEVKTEVKENNGKLEIKAGNNVEENENEDDDKGKNRVKILEKKNGEFKIWGPIQGFTSSSITIDGKTITYGKEIKIVGTIAIGKYAKVEGDNTESGMIAEEIVVDNRNKVTITPTISVTPTISITPTVTGSITPTVSVTPEVSGTPSVTPSETPVATETPTLQTSGNGFLVDELILNLENMLRRLFHFSKE